MDIKIITGTADVEGVVEVSACGKGPRVEKGWRCSSRWNHANWFSLPEEALTSASPPGVLSSFPSPHLSRNCSASPSPRVAPWAAQISSWWRYLAMKMQGSKGRKQISWKYRGRLNCYDHSSCFVVSFWTVVYLLYWYFVEYLCIHSHAYLRIFFVWDT